MRGGGKWEGGGGGGGMEGGRGGGEGEGEWKWGIRANSCEAVVRSGNDPCYSTASCNTTRLYRTIMYMNIHIHKRP